MCEHHINRRAGVGSHGIRTALLGIMSTVAIGCATAPVAAATAPAPMSASPQEVVQPRVHATTPGSPVSYGAPDGQRPAEQPSGYGDTGSGHDVGEYGESGTADIGDNGYGDTGGEDTGYGMEESPSTSPSPSTTSSVAPPVSQSQSATPSAPSSTTSPSASPSVSAPTASPTSPQPGASQSGPPRAESSPPAQLAKTGGKIGSYMLAASAAALIAVGCLCRAVVHRRRS
ncbi:hypothetical protein [Streptomyces longispororuber]|uniref:hypothetical protein n=1 Tax=Streptomyces longispororuber TaxID=68230 RepID=UPI00210B8257|nr:hypothetical protein [Streptomyces longispororuber]MCQ4206966.1 hypothetical protein [Streptomyces longispororuber]